MYNIYIIVLYIYVIMLHSDINVILGMDSNSVCHIIHQCVAPTLSCLSHLTINMMLQDASVHCWDF